MGRQPREITISPGKIRQLRQDHILERGADLRLPSSDARAR